MKGPSYRYLPVPTEKEQEINREDVIFSKIAVSLTMVAQIEQNNGQIIF